ncbi:hypothetical protein [Streptosporangium sp. NPDC048865]|uniref:hypothetical protein n=1 Tax=Streptosporangium sp. NPDC048865 TaxID=3155766 RepID=UPI003436D455
MPFLQLVTAHPVPVQLAESLAGAFGRALGLPAGAVIVQRIASGPGPAGIAEAAAPLPVEAAPEPVVDAGAVIVVRGRAREAAAMREAVAKAGALLAEGLGLDPDLVLVSWPDPGVVATGRGVLP